VQLDVSVFDKDHRPIRGLAMNDFTVLEKGTPQPLVALVPIEVADPELPSATWLRDAPLDTVSNAREARRLIMILLDDAGMGVELGEPKSVRDIAHRIVNSMGPDDLGSVVFTYLGKPQNWTADRSQLRAAIDSFFPKAVSAVPGPSRGIPPAGALPPSAGRSMGGVGGGPIACMIRRGGCMVDTLQNVGTALQEAPPGRKIIMLISSNGALNVMDSPDGISPVSNAFRALQRVNATVYAFDPRGLTTAPTGTELEDLRSIGAATGGRVFANTNAPEEKVRDVFRENGSYYLLGFRSADPKRDGRFRRIQVKVNRPGAVVNTRLGYYAPRDRDAEKNASKTPKPATAVDAALTSFIPSTDVPITLSVAAFAVPGKHEAALTLVSSLDENRPADGSALTLNVVASVYDMDGKSQATHRQRLELKLNTERVALEVYSRIPEIKPGRYEVRLAAESGGRAGSVFATVEVPDFAKRDLALSGVLVERAAAGVIANPKELASIVAVKPTAVRAFAREERARAFLRVYQDEPRSVRLATRVVNDRNESVFTRTEDLAASSFSDGAAEYFMELPLAQLTPGQYLMTIEASAADKRLTRDVRFSVK